MKVRFGATLHNPDGIVRQPATRPPGTPATSPGNRNPTPSCTHVAIQYVDGGPVGGHIESFKVHMHVSKGDYPAGNSASRSAVTCESGSNEQVLFTPTLGLGNPFVTSAANDDCTMLIEATVS